MTKDKALTQALDFIERVNKDGWILADFEPEMYAVITATKEALAQPEQKPIEENMTLACPSYLHDYTTPPQRTWVGLTDAEVQNIVYCRSPNIANLRKAEQLLKEKNK